MDGKLLDVIQSLDNISLALLLSLMSNNHCMIQSSSRSSLNQLISILSLAGSRNFGLSSTVVNCHSHTTIEDFRQELLIEQKSHSNVTAANELSLLDSLDEYTSRERDGLRIPNLIIIRNLQDADAQVQIQTLEVLRTGRIFTNTSIQSAPKPFVVVVVNSTDSKPLVGHLRDQLILSHVCEPEEDDEEAEEELEGHDTNPSSGPLINRGDIESLVEICRSVISTVEMVRYINDVVVFLRMHRAVAAGTTPLATKHLLQMTDCLATLHGMSYTTPALVGLAARKVFQHRLVMVDPAHERSLQYGSEFKAVRALLNGVTPSNVIEEVLETVECPL